MTQEATIVNHLSLHADKVKQERTKSAAREGAEHAFCHWQDGGGWLHSHSAPSTPASFMYPPWSSQARCSVAKQNLAGDVSIACGFVSCAYDERQQKPAQERLAVFETIVCHDFTKCLFYSEYEQRAGQLFHLH